MSSSKPNLSDAIRNNIAQDLLSCWSKQDKKLKHGAIEEIAREYGLNRKSVSRIWAYSLGLMEMGLPIYLTNKKSGIIRPKRLVFDAAFFKTVPLHKRKTTRRSAKSMGVSTTTILNWKKTKQIRTHTNAIKTLLSPAQRINRLVFCVKSLKLDYEHNNITFKTMYNTLHIDEKWFYLTKTSERYYLTPDEPDPLRTCVNKRYICKIMFICLVGRPIYALDGTCLFDGKIDIYPLTHQVAAVRNSINRDAGTLETKGIQSITRAVLKEYLITKILPDIKRKWPLDRDGTIFIMQDNARTHLDDADPDFRAVADADGFNIHLINQPANSPDMNINDLGWFRALQSLQEESAPANVDDLVAAVLNSYEELEDMKLNCVYLTLQSCMVETMKQRGHNNYRMPHMKKSTLIANGTLPIDIQVDPHLVVDCINYLNEIGMGGGCEELLQQIQEYLGQE